MIEATVRNLGALSGEVILGTEDSISGDSIPSAGDKLQSSKGELTVRVSWPTPFGLFISFDGPALAAGDTVSLPE